jgi:phosphatidylserine decarboxylase
MLNNNELAPQFEGGTIYQAFPNAMSYHRWHGPVIGTIVNICVGPGTYYSEAQVEGFSFSQLTNQRTPITGTVPTTPDPAGPNDSQGDATAVATRSMICTHADNPEIGLMCFMAVGMAEVSVILQSRRGRRPRNVINWECSILVVPHIVCLLFEPEPDLV